MNIRQVIPRDAILSVDDPAFGDTYTGEDGDRMIVLERDDEARAYPVRYLQFHEIVNDEFEPSSTDSGAVAVTWCPLCGSAVVYDRHVEGRTLTFGVSGKLADDDLVMYDRETESEWKQSSGKCIAGPLEGATLSVRPAAMLTWVDFEEEFPAGTALQPPGGTSEAAGAGPTPEKIDYDDEPYLAYFELDGFGLGAHRPDGESREWNRTDIDPKTVVLGVEADGEAVGFPLPTVRDHGGIVQTNVGTMDVVVFATEEGGIHGFRDPGYKFQRTDDAVVADGAVWNPHTGRADGGQALDRLPTRRLFAFAWQDDHGPNAFYGLR